ncbi:MAG: hypothetical protein FWE12_05820 [Oscillospiraceae bacterium]|nr:hypothetical protein [Oscillospiraceae bacterium]
MKTETRALTLTAIYVAAAVAMLFMGTIFPLMHLSFAALAGVFVAASVIEGGFRYGILCFAATAILGLLIVPDRTGVILYLTFLGAYPIIKSFAERQSSQIVGFAIKFAAFFLALTLYLTILQALVLGAIPFGDWALPLIYLGGAVAFLIYDIGMGRLISFYLIRIYKQREQL